MIHRRSVHHLKDINQLTDLLVNHSIDQLIHACKIHKCSLNMDVMHSLFSSEKYFHAMTMLMMMMIMLMLMMMMIMLIMIVVMKVGLIVLT